MLLKHGEQEANEIGGQVEAHQDEERKVPEDQETSQKAVRADWARFGRYSQPITQQAWGEIVHNKIVT